MKKTSVRNPLLLLLTAVIWGVAFVAQSVGTDYVGAFTFNFARCMIGGIVLIPCIFLLDHVRCGKRENGGKMAGGSGAGRNCRTEEDSERAVYTWKQKELYTGGLCCGAALFVAGNLQQFGIQYTTVGKAGFITALYIVLVPLFGIFLKKKVGAKIWCSVVLAVFGLYLLCMTDGLSIGAGDFLVLAPVSDGSSGSASLFSKLSSSDPGGPVTFALDEVRRLGDGGLYLKYLAQNAVEREPV